MGALKAPSPNGFHALFFQSQQDVVSDTVCEEIKSIFNFLDLIKKFNETPLVLIPKVDNLEELS